MGALVAFVYIFGGFDSGVNRDYCVLRVTLTLLHTSLLLQKQIGLLMGKEGLIFSCNLSSASNECFVVFFPPFCLWVFFFVLRFFYCIVLECLIFKMAV